MPKVRSLVASLVLMLLPLSVFAANFGDCSANTDIRLLRDGRKAKLLADLRYVDPRMKIWLAEAGKEVDGASIPWPLWDFIGTPFTGKYRDASVLHDVECEAKREPWEAVHAMFFQAMRCYGVGAIKAKIMYAAVYYCGPRWGEDQGVRLIPCADESLTEYIRRFKVFFNENRHIPLREVAQLSLASFEGIDGSSPLEKLRRRGLEVVGTEDLEGFTIILTGVAANPAGYRLSYQYDPGTDALLAALAEELGSPSEAAVMVEGIPDAEGPMALESDVAQSRAEGVTERLSHLGLKEARVWEETSGVSGTAWEKQYDEVPQLFTGPPTPPRTVVIRVVQVQEDE